MDYKTLTIQQLKATFPDYKVYDEMIPQGLTAPCFHVKASTIDRSRRLGSQVRLTQSIAILLIPPDITDTDTRQEDMDAIIHKLASDPTWKYLGGRYHIHNLAFEVQLDRTIITFTVTGYQRYQEETVDRFADLAMTATVVEAPEPEPTQQPEEVDNGPEQQPGQDTGQGVVQDGHHPKTTIFKYDSRR